MAYLTTQVKGELQVKNGIGFLEANLCFQTELSGWLPPSTLIWLERSKNSLSNALKETETDVSLTKWSKNNKQQLYKKKINNPIKKWAKD